MVRLLAVLVCLVLVGSSWGTEEAPKALKEILPNGMVDKDGKAVTLDQLKGKIVGVYFSAHWCPPCRAFTPQLVEFRDKNAKEFEVVFVSSDKSEADQKKYMEETKMQWYTLKWNGADANALKKKFNVTGIPKLVILKPNGELLTAEGRGDVTAKPDKALAEWKEKAK